MLQTSNPTSSQLNFLWDPVEGVYKVATTESSQNAPFYLSVAKGEIPGHSYVKKFGHKLEINSADGEEDIWAYDGNMSYLSSAETIGVSSSHTGDSVGGFGVQSINISGLDGSYLEIGEDINLSGTVSTFTTKQYLRVNRVKVLTVGISGANPSANLGDIDLSGVTSEFVQARIPVGLNQTQQTQFTVPAGKTAYLVHVKGTIKRESGANGVKIGEMAIKARESGSVFRQLTPFYGMATDGESVEDMPNSIPEKFVERTDIKGVCATESNDASFGMSMDLLLVNN